MVPTRYADRILAHEVDRTQRERLRGWGRQPDRQRGGDTHMLRVWGWLAERGEQGVHIFLSGVARKVWV